MNLKGLFLAGLLGLVSCRVVESPNSIRTDNSNFDRAKRVHSYAWELDYLSISKRGLRGICRKIGGKEYNMGAMRAGGGERYNHLYIIADGILFSDLGSDGILNKVKVICKEKGLVTSYDFLYASLLRKIDNYFKENIEKEREFYREKRRELGLSHLDVKTVMKGNKIYRFGPYGGWGARKK